MFHGFLLFISLFFYGWALFDLVLYIRTGTLHDIGLPLGVGAMFLMILWGRVVLRYSLKLRSFGFALLLISLVANVYFTNVVSDEEAILEDSSKMLSFQFVLWISFAAVAYHHIGCLLKKKEGRNRAAS